MTRLREVLISRTVALVASLLFVCTASAWAVQVSPRDIAANPERFDGQVVTVKGSVAKLRTGFFRRAGPHYYFDLVDGSASVTVFSSGTTTCKEGMTAHVEGRVKAMDHTVYNLFATRVKCQW